MPGPLAHLTVLDLTDLRGALAGRLLADLGADVVKIEPPGGDPGRLQPPFAGNVAAPDRSLPFLFRNANKRGAVIDLHDPDDAARFSALCAGADVLIENYGLNRRQVLDLAPEVVRERYPQLVHVALTDFGLSGPRAHWRAEPLVAFAGSGALFASGFADRPPCWLPGFAAHDCAAVVGVIGALAALRDRARHGAGQTVEVSVQEAAISGLNPWQIPLADYHRLYSMLPTAPPRNADGSYPVIAVADGHVRVLAAGQRHWRGFVDLLGHLDAFAGEEWNFAVFRMLNAHAIRLVAGEALRHRTRADVHAAALARGVPLAPIHTPDEFVAAEQTRTRGYFRRTDFPHLGEAPFAPAPFNFSATPVELRRPAPALDATRSALPSESLAGAASPIGEPALRPAHAAPEAGGPPAAGVRAVIFGYAAVVPELGVSLAELGADVIRIESRAHLDLLRAITVEPDRPNRAFTFNDASRGQRSVCLDMRQPRARALALALCAAADVVAENYRGGVLRGWGLDYESVRRQRPDVVYLSSSGFGESGPLASAPSFGPLNAAFAGVNWLWNFPDAPYPAGSSLNHPDHVASKLATLAVLAALEHRRRSGEGQHIEMAQSEAAAFLIGERYLELPCTGRAPRQQGNAADDAVPHGVYPCAGDDRWCAIAVHGDNAWQRFQRCLGWEAEAGWSTLAGRLAARAEIDRRVAAWTRARSADDAATTLQAAGISAMAVLGPDELRVDAHLLARDAIVTVEHPEVGPERHIANPLRMSGTTLVTAPAAPFARRRHGGRADRGPRTRRRGDPRARRVRRLRLTRAVAAARSPGLVPGGLRSRPERVGYHDTTGGPAAAARHGGRGYGAGYEATAIGRRGVPTLLSDLYNRAHASARPRPARPRRGPRQPDGRV
jgi:crotonobetainyl-CoA:carnitine CoA-transferase CaiB-like acyl-CoA transferase